MTSLLLALETLVGLLRVVDPASVVDRDFVTRGRRGSATASDDLSLDTHYEII